MRCSAGLLCASLLGLALSFPAAAAAGPVEQLVQLALHPTDPKRMVLRYANGGEGLLYTRDAGESWQLVCSSLFDTSTVRLLALGIGAEGTTLAADSSGVWSDDGAGCAFHREPLLDGEWVPDLVVHPMQARVLYAVTAGTARASRVARRGADGTWSVAGMSPERLVLRMRAGVGSGGVRLYESARIFRQDDDAGFTLGSYMIRVSDDEGVSWREHRDSADDGSELEIEAVDPLHPERIVARRRAADPHLPDTVLVSRDEGASFEDYLEVPQLTSAVFLPSGELFVGAVSKPGFGAVSGGLWRAADLHAPAVKLSDAPVRCLAYQPLTGTLFACHELELGSVDLESGAFASLVKTKTVDTLVSCPGVDVAAQCQRQLCTDWCGASHFPQAPLCAVYTGRVSGCGCDTAYSTAIDGCAAPPFPVEVAARDAGTVAEPVLRRARGGGCTCSLVSRARGAGRSAACSSGLLLALAVWRHKRRQRRSA